MGASEQQDNCVAPGEVTTLWAFLPIEAYQRNEGR